MNLRHIGLSASALLALGAGGAIATPITSTGYTFDQATDSGSFVYSAWGAELIDGVLGDAVWATHSGVEWDGWLGALINIDFAFAGAKTFNSVSVGSSQDNPFDVVLPILPSEGKADTTAFLELALAWLGRHGVSVKRVMTYNGSAYRSKLFAEALQRPVHGPSAPDPTHQGPTATPSASSRAACANGPTPSPTPHPPNEPTPPDNGLTPTISPEPTLASPASPHGRG